jgi:putative acetyltransferase
VIDDRDRPATSQGPSKDGPCCFRRAQPRDRDAVVALVFDTLRAYGIEPDPHGLDADVMRFGDAGNPSIAEFVAVLDGRVVGSVALRDRGDGTGHFSKFFVDAAVRGRGVGRALLELAVSEARKRGVRELDLETRSQFGAAVHLYESTGWKRGPDPSTVCDRTYLLRL